jgi:hypothetical protein
LKSSLSIKLYEYFNDKLSHLAKHLSPQSVSGIFLLDFRILSIAQKPSSFFISAALQGAFMFSRLNVALSVFFVLVPVLFSANASGSINDVLHALDLDIKKSEGFSDLYSEQIGMSRVETFATYSQLRYGWRHDRSWETYATLRFGADTRTILDTSNSIYNDNYLFFGVGVDYLGLIPGVRAVTQIGASTDVSSKIQLGGLDTRLGIVTFHELRPGVVPVYFQIYSESLYIRRYSNILSNIQFRSFYDVLKSNHFELAPTVALVGAIDSQALEYNRFVEARAGFGLKWSGDFTVSLTPYYVLGTRWDRPTSLPRYQDFRALVTLSLNF